MALSKWFRFTFIAERMKFLPSVRRKHLMEMESNNFKERIDDKLRHLFDGSELNVYENNFINLSAGTPNENLLAKCNQLFEDATKHLVQFEAANHSYLYQYGPSCGTYRFRTNLSEFLSKKYQSKVEAADLILTSGATYGLLLILATLIDYNGVVFLDEATYMIALESISDFNTLRIIPVRLKDDGVDLEDLEEKIIKYKFKSESKMFFGCYYTMPTFHNPTGLLFSPETCEALIGIARKHDLLIVCDDVYNLLHYDDEKSPKRLYAYDSFDDVDFKGNVISNGSLSKILAPGARVGWMECPPRIAKSFHNSGFLKSGGAPSNYVSGVITSMIELGTLDEHVSLCWRNYKAQRDALVNVLTENLPSNCTFYKPRGGYFIWVKLPDHIDGENVCDFILKKYKVFFIKGSRFSVKNKCKNFVRISFAFHPPETLSKAGKSLCEGLKEYLTVHNAIE